MTKQRRNCKTVIRACGLPNSNELVDICWGRLGRTVPTNCDSSEKLYLFTGVAAPTLEI